MGRPRHAAGPDTTGPASHGPTGTAATRLATALVAAAVLVAGVPVLAAEGEAVVVVLEPGPEPVLDVADRLVAAHGGERGFVYRHALRGFSAVLPAAGVDALARNPQVAYIDRDVPVSVAQTTSQVLPTGVDRVEADLNPGRASFAGDVTVAVIDTGVWFAGGVPHADLNLSVVFDCTHIYNIFGVCAGTNYADENGHGTHVAGIIGAEDNGIGSLGVAPGAEIYSFKVLNADGTGTLSGVLAGIDAVTGRAAEIEVANMSLSVTPAQQSLDDAVANSIAAGIVYVVAAGNSGADAAGSSPARVPDAVTVSALADFDGAAGGLGGPTCRNDVADDRLAGWSNFGAVVDVAAPGVCIYSTWLDDGYATLSGTSMASPMVAGAVARYVAEHRRATDRAGVLAIRDAVVAGALPQAAACGFGGDPDAYPEPLLFLNGPAFGGTGECTVAGSTNTPPAAADDAAATDEDTAVVVDVLANDSDPDGDPLAVAAVTSPAHGTATVTAGKVTYTPAPDYSGPDTFTYTVGDGTATDTAVVTVAVRAVNDPPVAAFTGSCDGLTCAFTDTSTDGDGPPGTRRWDFGDGATSTAAAPTHTYPAAGTYTVTLTVTDGTGATDTATAPVTVSSPEITASVQPILFDGRDATVEVWVFRTSDTEMMAGATVTGEWRYADRRGRERVKVQSAVSDASGVATFAATFRNSEVLGFCVTSVVLDGYRYVATPDVACSDGYLSAVGRRLPPAG